MVAVALSSTYGNGLSLGKADSEGDGSLNIDLLARDDDLPDTGAHGGVRDAAVRRLPC